MSNSHINKIATDLQQTSNRPSKQTLKTQTLSEPLLNACKSLSLSQREQPYAVARFIWGPENQAPAPDPRGVFEGAAEHLRGGARPPRRALPRREVPARRSNPAASPADPRAARTVPPSAGGRSRGEGCSAGLPAARLSPLCRGGLFNQLTGLAEGLFRVCLAHRARSLGRPPSCARASALMV